MDALLQIIHQFAKLSPLDIELLNRSLHSQHLKKGQHFLLEGDVSRKIGFIEKGIMRVYVTNEQGEEDTCYFLREQQFAVALESFNRQIPAPESLQAVTDCALLTLSYDKMQLLYQQIPQWQSIVAKLTEDALLNKLYHRSPLVNADAKTRYENFLRDHADIAIRIPLGYLASYLGITQQSLSRLRREIMQG